MIYSPTKKLHLEYYNELLELLEVLVRLYKKEPSEELNTLIQKTVAWVGDLKKEISTTDYITQDAAFKRVMQSHEEWLREHNKT